MALKPRDVGLGFLFLGPVVGRFQAPPALLTDRPPRRVVACMVGGRARVRKHPLPALLLAVGHGLVVVRVIVGLYPLRPQPQPAQPHLQRRPVVLPLLDVGHLLCYVPVPPLPAPASRGPLFHRVAAVVQRAAAVFAPRLSWRARPYARVEQRGVVRAVGARRVHLAIACVVAGVKNVEEGPVPVGVLFAVLARVAPPPWGLSAVVS